MTRSGHHLASRTRDRWRRTLALIVSMVLCGALGLVGAPSATAASLPGGEYLYVALGDQVAVVNTATGAVAAQIGVPGADGALVTGPGNGMVYATSTAGVTVINALTATVVGSMTRPNGVYTSLAVAPDDTRLYALDAAAGLVDIFEPASRTLVGSVILGSASWADLVLVPQRSRLYVSAGSAASLAVIDTTTSMPADDISTTSPGQGMAPSPDGARVYVAEPNQAAPAASLIEAIDTTAGTLANTWGQSSAASDLAVSPSGTTLFAAGAVSPSLGLLVEVDASTGVAGRFAESPGSAFGTPVVSTDGGTLFVPQVALPSVLVVDTATFATSSFTVSAAPQAVTFVDLTTPVFGSAPAATFIVGVAQAFEVIAVGQPAPSLTVTGTLPAGVTFTDTGGGTGRLSGTATVPGVYPLTFTATNASGATVQQFTLTVPVPPGAPTITSLTAGDGSVQVAFAPGTAGSSPTTGYLVRATDFTEPSRGGQTAVGSTSPITVTGLTNEDAYTFTVTALSAGGDSPPSAASDRINVGIPGSITGTPPEGTVGVAYAFTFTVGGVPAPAVALDPSTTLPDGLRFDPGTATISGTPTAAGTTPISISARNGVGTGLFDGNLVIREAPVSEEPTPTPTPPTTPPPYHSPGPWLVKGWLAAAGVWGQVPLCWWASARHCACWPGSAKRCGTPAPGKDLAMLPQWLRSAVTSSGFFIDDRPWIPTSLARLRSWSTLGWS